MKKMAKFLYGIEANIYKVDWEFYAVFGDNKELLINGYEGVSRRSSYSVDEILKEYKNLQSELCQ